MFNVKGCFKNRTVGFYLSFGAACVAFIAAIAYLVVTASEDMSLMQADNQISGFDRTFSLVGFIIVLVGALSEILVVFTDFKFAIVIPTVLTAVGAGVTLSQCIYTLMDVFNGINFYGGNLGIAFAIPILLGVVVIVECVASFMSMRKEAVKESTNTAATVA